MKQKSKALLYPDEEEIKRIVEERKLPAVFDKEKNAWLFPKGDWESLLVSKAFWRLNLCLPFTKKKPENPSSETTPAVITPAEQPATQTCVSDCWLAARARKQHTMDNDQTKALLLLP